MTDTDTKLVLIGGGGHCKTVIDIAASSNREILGIIDRAIPAGTKVLGIPVLGNDDMIPELVKKYGHDIEFVVTVGQLTSSAVRRRLADNVEKAGGRFAWPIIAETAHIGLHTAIGNGTVIGNNTVINPDAKIGKNCIINTGAIIEHDCTIGDFVHVSTGAIINGKASVGSDSFMASNTTVFNCISITDHVTVGAGGVVTKDITESGTYYGIPAKLISK